MLLAAARIAQPDHGTGKECCNDVFNEIGGGLLDRRGGFLGRDDGGEGPHIEDYEGDGDDLLIATGK